MSDNIQNMDFKKLRNEVQLLRDELAIMKRKYEDILYNLDDDNFSSQFLKEKDGMKTEISVTAEGIKTKVSKDDFESAISQTSTQISAIVSGYYTGDMLDSYLSGIEINPTNIKMITSSETYSVFSSKGLRFYDSSEQIEGWSIEPDSLYGGLLKYYVNDSINWVFGRDLTNYVSGDAGYTTTDMTIYGEPNKAGGFVVDVSESANPQIKFFVADWSTTKDTPRILANGQLLATQEWVRANGGGDATARFG